MSLTTFHSDGAFPLAPAVLATFSLEHYEHMVECGAFAGAYEKNVELLWGRIVELAPIGPPHSNDVDELTAWSIQVTSGQPIRVRIQNPVRLPNSTSMPQPDICWVRQRDYSKQHPNGEDILLLIEIAESSLAEDRSTKLAAYAQAGIQDYWIVNLIDQQGEVFRQPSGLVYGETKILRGEELIAPLAMPSASVTANKLLANPSS